MGRPEERVEVLGVGVDPLTVEGLNAEIGRGIRAGGHALVLNANVHCLNLAYGDPKLRSFLNGAEMVFCDGAGVMLAARLLGRPDTGAYHLRRLGLAPCVLCPPLKGSHSTFSAPPWRRGESCGEAQRALPGPADRRHPTRLLRPIHRQPGERGRDREDKRRAPDILLVGFGMPFQERWLMESWGRIDARVALTGGAVFDYISGELRRGPTILTDNGFEWLARLLVEPRRLWRRYVVGNPVFLWRVIRQLISR